MTASVSDSWRLMGFCDCTRDGMPISEQKSLQGKGEDRGHDLCGFRSFYTCKTA